MKVFSHILPYYKLPVLGFIPHSKIWNELVEEKWNQMYSNKEK